MMPRLLAGITSANEPCIVPASDTQEQFPRQEIARKTTPTLGESTARSLPGQGGVEHPVLQQGREDFGGAADPFPNLVPGIMREPVGRSLALSGGSRASAAQGVSIFPLGSDFPVDSTKAFV